MKFALFYSRHSVRPYLLILSYVLLSGCGGTDDGQTSPNDTAAPSDVTALAGRVTVSGVSSGGYMAVQSHVALSDRISGAGVIAAGPYHCAAGSVMQALGACLSGEDLDAQAGIDFAKSKAASGEIASIEHLNGDKVWVFHSTADSVVSSIAGKALVDFYREFLPAESVAFLDKPESGHGWPTLENGVACGEVGEHFLNACDFDASGELLSFLYTDLAAPSPSESMLPLRTLGVGAMASRASDIADEAFAYVPESCTASTANCRLHIAFHGCRQGAEFVGDAFARNNGLNEWANTNQMVVLYPQVEKSITNPQGCWDWWGYTDDNYDLASGAQVDVVRALIDAFAREQLLR
jgi:poly(3-hydroxybutyrate) depolymerase